MIASFSRTGPPRPMVWADLPAVVALEARVQSHPWREGHFRDCLRAGHEGWVLELPGLEAGQAPVVVGFAVASPGAGEAELLNLAVAPECRRRGLGRELLDWLWDDLGARAQCLLLEVRVSNRPAIRLYEDRGFAAVGRRRGYYPAASGREDALIMRLDR